MRQNALQQHDQQGYILVVSLILLLAMTLMGLGLLHVSLTEKKLVERSVINQEKIFVVAETCVQEAESWLLGQIESGAPSLPHTSPLTAFATLIGASSSSEIAQFNQYSFTYTVEQIGSAGGNDIGESASYSKGGGSSGQAIYRIICPAYKQDPDKSTMTIVREITL